MIVTKHPDGRWLAWLPGAGGPAAWLDLEAEAPFPGVLKLAYVLGGARPAFSVMEWDVFGSAWRECAILTYDDVLRPPAGFMRFLARRWRAEAKARNKLRVRRRAP